MAHLLKLHACTTPAAYSMRNWESCTQSSAHQHPLACFISIWFHFIHAIMTSDIPEVPDSVEDRAHHQSITRLLIVMCLAASHSSTPFPTKLTVAPRELAAIV